MDNVDIQSRTQDRHWWTLAVLCLSLLVIVVDNTIVNVALPTLARDLNAGTSALQWIVDAYTLVFAALLLTAGALGDRLGRKGALTAGLVIFGLASVSASMAGSASQLIAARAVMGIGAALIMPATLSILTNVFTVARERALAIGIWSAVSGIAIALGPVSGGFLLSHFAWGSIFLVNAPLVAVALVAGQRLVPTSKDPAGHRLDWWGAALSAAGLTALVWAFIEAPSNGWASAPIVAAFVAAVVVLAAFVRYELRIEHPMLDMRFFANPRFTAASVSVTFMFFALMGFIFGVSQYLQGVMGFTALAAGVRTLPFAVAVMVMAPISAPLAHRLGTKVVVSSGLALFAAGLAIASTLGVSTTYTIVCVAMVVMGSGMGLAMAPATESVMGSLPKEHAGVGSAVNDTTRELGGTLGVAIGGSAIASIYGGRMTSALAGGPIPPSAAKIARDSFGGALAVADRAGGAQGDALRSAARSAFSRGLRLDSLITMAVTIVGVVVAAVFLPARSTTTDDVTVKVDRALEPVGVS